MTMKLHQPVMFVGLGGTGCRIGSELERRLRSELCGPDGLNLVRDRQNTKLLPYQLPSCFQFVYADIDVEELKQAKRRSVPGEEHEHAVSLTAHYSNELVPPLMNSYPEVAASLRLTAPRYVAPWLPPADGEPRIAPLRAGAGQLPTVGRAALFETLRTGSQAVRRDLAAAAGRLAQSGEDLKAFGAEHPNTVDIFVAFSVAGGTGAGSFFDYLHLIGDVLQPEFDDIKIYPLVVMPSAFPKGAGGGRPAQLNAGRALLDLYRLVDEQNSGAVNTVLRPTDPLGASEAIELERSSVQYPGAPPIELKAGTVQTGFLFSLPISAEREDLHRSIVAFVLSLVGQKSDDAEYQSFARDFINRGVIRQTQADNGIGNRGVSTAQVASLTVPVDELGDLVAGRLLREAVHELSSPLSGIPEDNAEYFEIFFNRSKIHTLVARDQPQIAEPEPVMGAMQIAAALRERVSSMKQSLEHLQHHLVNKMQSIAGDFAPRDALKELIGATDPYRARRVLFGDPKLPIDWQRQGIQKIMHGWKAPEPPEGITHLPPPLPPMKDRLFRRVRWADPEVVAAIQQQNDWYAWRTKVIWGNAWSQQEKRWTRALEDQKTPLVAFADALDQLARSDVEHFRRQSDDLARARVGVSYLLPLQGGTFEEFYQRVATSMVADRHENAGLRQAATSTELLQHVLQGGRWWTIYQASVNRNVATAVAGLRESVKEVVVGFLQNRDQTGANTILPPMATRLRQAAGLEPVATGDADVQEFKGKLAGLIPGAFAPQGRGSMKVLISYPGAKGESSPEAFLRQALNLPKGPGIDVEFRPTESESLSVVMFRHGMSVTAVDEVRDVLRTWSQALAKEQLEDKLKWRQRTGYRFDYLATREEHRVLILHHLLSALWNGKIATKGDPDSPTEISVALGDIAMELPLRSFGAASSWADVVHAYELAALEDDRPLWRSFCEQLMDEAPRDLDRLDTPPHEHFLRVVKLAPEQMAQLDAGRSRLRQVAQARSDQYKRFWTHTLPKALSHPFRYQPIVANLAELTEHFQGRNEA